MSENSHWIELTPLWIQRNGRNLMSAEIMDDRIQDLLEAMQQGPVRLYLKFTDLKRGERSPDARLLIASANQEKRTTPVRQPGYRPPNKPPPMSEEDFPF
ncbi:MAG: hypothetical protein V1685_04490 [Parcubacteria group bacterium]